MNLRLPFALVLLLLLATHLCAGPRDEQWQKVEAAIDQKLPQSAIAALEPIIASAQAEGAHAEALKAIGRKIALEREIQGGKPEEQIIRLLAELEKAPPAMKPAMEAMIAHWYWHYFRNNRGRFLQRTQTAGAAGDDFQTWDLARILSEIDQRFTAALAGEKILKTTPISAYAPLLEPGTAPAAYRPTLFDFLAHEALEFYQAGEHAAIQAEETFVLDADSPIFADVDEFLRWEPKSAEEHSPVLRSIRLFQRLLEFHRGDADKSAYFDVDFERLNYGHNTAVGEDKDERYQAALERFIKATEKHEISARALATLASEAYQAGDPARAHALATRGAKGFPESAGAIMCVNLIRQIEAKEANLRTESVWSAPWPTLDVTYRNITEVHFRAIAADFEEHLPFLDRPRWHEASHAETLLRSPAALEWSASLPATTDFATRTQSLPAPASLKPGFYFIVASHHRSFDPEDNQISVVPVWVSDLALVTNARAGGKDGGFVLRADTGEPVADATVRVFRRDRRGSFVPAHTTKSDQNGRFSLTVRDQQMVIVAHHGGHTVSSLPLWHPAEHRERDVPQVVFFTDRALYRPGQGIHYKGIAIRQDRVGANYETLARTRIEVSFRDANGQEVSRAAHVTNDFGSFSGIFTAPRDRGLGHMSLAADGGASGYASFRVEEYKRPKFQVELSAPTEAPKLAAPTRLTGKATAYTGAAIGNAQVKWRVVRETQLPRWCWWWNPVPPKAIAHGTALTAADGTFEITFTAEPDLSVPEKNEPVFTFSINADVTDITGETRSDDHAVRIGYTALQAEVAAGEWQTPDQPVAIEITTHSLDGMPQGAKGTLAIHPLKQPEKVSRAPLANHRLYSHRFGARLPTEPDPDPTNPDAWEIGAAAESLGFQTNADGAAKLSVTLPAGIYRLQLETQDRFGKKVTARQTLQVLDPSAARYPTKLANHLAAPAWSVEPGQDFKALWSTGYERGRAYVELESAGRTLKSYWTSPDRTQDLISLPITEKLRGGVTLRVTYVRENRAYLNERLVDVPWSNKELAIKWETFRSKLLPGQAETWSAIVTGPDAQRASAEMVAALYDASLDQFAPHHWRQSFTGFRQEYVGRGNTSFHNTLTGFQQVSRDWNIEHLSVDWRYPTFTEDLGGWRYSRDEDVLVLSPFMVASPRERGYAAASTLAGNRMRTESVAFAAADAAAPQSAPPPPGGMAKSAAPDENPAAPDLNQVTARRNLNETAFFFPHLVTDEAGTVKIQFTMPEALTEWKFLGFAHDPELRSGYLTAKAVTVKDLMVEPNPPRFVREGDMLEFTVKVSNQTDHPQTGRVRLSFADAATLASVDAALGNQNTEQDFNVPAKQSRSYSWRIAVPDGMGFLTYKAVGASAQASDGEEGFLPVLSRRILVTESLPLPIRGPATKEFEFKKLIESGQSQTLKHQALTVQMVSQPAWYAVLALPYLMEYPHECNEQVFNRLYANTLARHVAGSDPKIRRIFDLWKNTPALDSPLMKNQDLKSVMIEETPWLRDASDESQARRNVGLLFDENRLNDESSRALAQLAERQRPDGMWSWFPGGGPNEYITLYITTGFGRLRQLGAKTDLNPALRSLDALDAWIAQRHRDALKRKNPQDHIPNSLEALYLYGRSFFLSDKPIARDSQAAVDFFLEQSRKYWTKVGSRQSEAHLALALQRFGDRDTPQAIMKSLKERSVTSEELGRYWRDQEHSWWWFHAPIETQALMIEAFDEVAQDAQAVEDCKVWLLKQKQTRDWKTTKATADAVYGLLRRGRNLLSSDALVEVELGGKEIEPANVEAGTGFYEQKFFRSEIQPAMGRVTVRKVDEGVSWGSVHWQYLEDMRKVTPHEGTPLKLKKALYIKETTSRGPVLKPVTGPVAVGDELVVRLELRTDRDMEYIHLKDQRGSGTEPVNVLSQYKYQDGLAYYESTRDTASHFFIDYLPKGTYVFEYSTRVQLKGAYQTGIAEIQCMYAPEFNSHSESFELQVK